jgi:hypothetical protein
VRNQGALRDDLAGITNQDRQQVERAAADSNRRPAFQQELALREEFEQSERPARAVAG